MKTLWMACMIVMVLFGMTVIIFPDVPSELSYYLPQVVGLYKSDGGEYKTTKAFYQEAQEEIKKRNDATGGRAGCLNGHKVTIFTNPENINWPIAASGAMWSMPWLRINKDNPIIDCETYNGEKAKCINYENVPCESASMMMMKEYLRR